MTATNGVTLILGIEPNTAAGWIKRGKTVESATKTNGPMFASILTLLGQLSTDLAAADKAQAAAANNGKAEAKARNAALVPLKKSVRGVAFAVQGLCDEAPDVEHAHAIAAASGFPVKDTTKRPKGDFTGKALGKGDVHLYARLPKKNARAFHEWQMSADGGKTWVGLPGTNDADTVVTGLTPLTVVRFQHRVTVKNVTSAWSQSIDITVI